MIEAGAMELNCLSMKVRPPIFLLLALTLLLAPIEPALANIPVTAGGAGDFLAAGPAGLPTSLTEFSQELPRGKAASPVGVYVQDVLALRVLAQPVSNPGYVTAQPEAVSLFRLAQQYGTVGLIAHNYLAGQSFFDLSAGQQVVLIMADGTRQRYKIESIRQLQALSPWSPTSDFLPVGGEGPVVSATQLFHQIYSGTNRVVFQTCIELDGNPVWGRLFVTAERIDPQPAIDWAVKLPRLLLDRPLARTF